jgi:hypothetical protein
MFVRGSNGGINGAFYSIYVKNCKKKRRKKHTFGDLKKISE